MKKMFFVGVMFTICCVQLFVGAVQLGLYNSPKAPAIAMVATLVCCITLAIFIATWLGDKLVLKYYRYDTNERGRWSYYSCGGYNTAPGVGLRVVIHILFLTPFLYHTTLL